MANEKALALDDKTILAYGKPDAKRWVRDGGGLALCLTPAKKGAWRFWYYIYTSPETGKKCYKPLGSYPDMGLKAARDAAKLLSADILKKIDPMGQERREMQAKVQADEELRRKIVTEEQNITVARLVNNYIEQHAKVKKRSWAKDEAILNRDVVPAWGQRKAKDIVKGDVKSLLKDIIGRGAPAMANNCFQIIRKMFNWAIEEDVLTVSPCHGIKLPSPKTPKDRALTEEEIRTLWASLDRTDLCMSLESRRALKLILVTAQRPGEVIGMHTSEIGGRWWTLPKERAKNGREHRVYLTKTALDLIGPLEVMDEETGKMKPKGYIFPSPVKATKKTPGQERIEPIGDTALAITVGRNLSYPLTDTKGNPLYNKDGSPATENRLGVVKFTPHDLRRTANTLMAASKILKEYRERVLNHVLEKLDGTYNQHDYDDEKQMALEALERKILGILDAKKNNVIPINAGKKAA